MKDTYYFSHDANARNDEKILMLRAKCGWEGYGVYWALIEMMFESSDTSLCYKKLQGIATNFNIDVDRLKMIIDTAIFEKLFTKKNDKIFSESLKKRKEKLENSRNKKSNAGKIGMQNRYNTTSDNSVITPLQHCYNSDITETNKGKESKGKERKGEREKESTHTPIFLTGYYENVRLTEEQVEQLKKDFPKQWDTTLERLSSYIQETGKTYKDHFSVLTRWCKEDILKAKEKVEVKRTLADRELP